MSEEETEAHRAESYKLQAQGSAKQAEKWYNRCQELKTEKKVLVEGLEEATRAFNRDSVQGNGEYGNGLYCGLEDRNITDRYEAMDHGYECALGRVQDEVMMVIEETLAKAKALERE